MNRLNGSRQRVWRAMAPGICGTMAACSTGVSAGGGGGPGDRGVSAHGLGGATSGASGGSRDDGSIGTGSGGSPLTD